MKQMSAEHERCIEACLDCYRACHGMVMSHCLETGGAHASPSHVRLMSACAEVCRTSAHLMLMKSEHAPHLCRECAEICEQCAQDCERLGGMQACVDACRTCADACRTMAA